ncbi:hypothetical protein C0J52_14384 [Blattella germanica]|nr:hypothetical protein C0J52_14384 [Blattella germanica]
MLTCEGSDHIDNRVSTSFIDFKLFLAIVAPARGFWLLWVSILSPWFFQQAPPAQEVDEKKQRKLERRMKRH